MYSSIIPLIYILVFIICIIIDIRGQKTSKSILLFACIILPFIVGTRDIYYWPDTYAYAYDFNVNTPDILSFKLDNKLCYPEKGFYILSSLLKTCTYNTSVYFTIISALTFLCLYKVLSIYSPYPLIGLFVYMARFFLSRDFMQIRASLAIALFLIGLNLITHKNKKRNALLFVVSCSLHQSILITGPFYFINRIKFSKKHIIYGLIASFILAGFASSLVKSTIIGYAELLDINSAYTSVDNRFSIGVGLKNPMIYYQCLVLLIFTFTEERLLNYNYYYTIRNAYFYTTVILIVFSSFLTIASRGSTIFATLEIIIVPLILYSLPEKFKTIGTITICMLYSILFFMNYQKILIQLS